MSGNDDTNTLSESLYAPIAEVPYQVRDDGKRDKATTLHCVMLNLIQHPLSGNDGTNTLGEGLHVPVAEVPYQVRDDGKSDKAASLLPRHAELDSASHE